MSIDDVRALVAERQRYDDWLAALEAKRSDTPARVFERVHGDYYARRSGVIDRLREHIDSLSSLGDDLEGRIGELESQLAAYEDERAEAMLRTAVGEYDADRWESVRQDVEAKIAQLAEKRSGLLAEVDDVRTLLSSARSESPQSTVASEPAPTPVVEFTHPDPTPELLADSGSGAVPIAEEAIELAPVYSADAGPERDAAEELFTPAASRPLTPGVPIPVAQASFIAPTQEELDGTDFDDALALFSPRAQPTAAQPTPLHGRTVDMLDGFEAEPSPEPSPSTTVSSTAPEAVRTTAPQPVAAEAAQESTRDSFDDLAFLRSVIDPATQSTTTRSGASGEQQKTLRCTECGTMNFPTEWYCERCGGELAAF